MKFYAHSAEDERVNPLPETSGKWQPLNVHLRNVADSAKKLAEPLGLRRCRGQIGPALRRGSAGTPVTPGEKPQSLIVSPDAQEALPLSLLNDYLYCPRRAALKVVEGWREANVHTERGDIAHEHDDLPGYEVAKGVTLLRALPVWSERLGLSGKCDIVEAEFHSASTNLKFEISDSKSLRPVEFKLGKRRQWENDDAQLCAQALCLEEMFGVAIPRGAVFHADSKRRREVEFTVELRALAENAVAGLHALLAQSEISNLRFEIPRLPPAVWKPACAECSLFEVCLPKVTGPDPRAARLARELFEI